jgi:hypothetical protein
MSERITKNRLENFRRIVRLAGGNNAAARMMGKGVSYGSYLSQIIGKNPTRNIGDDMATNIEKKFGLAPGELDNDPPKQTSEDPFVTEIVATLSHLGPADKEFVLGMTEWIAKRSVDDKNSIANQPGKIDLVGEALQLNYDLRDIDSEKKKEDAATIITGKAKRGENARKPKRITDHKP